MSKTILIASVLKPVNDVRLYYKLGRSLCKINGFSVKICAYEGKIPEDEQISFFPIYSYPNLNSVWRLFSPLKFFFLLLKLKPKLIIFSTHELFLICRLYRFFTGCKIVFDIRENYKINLTADQFHKKWMRQIALFYYRKIVENNLDKLDHVIIAEDIYAQQLNLVQNKVTLLANKSVFPHKIEHLKREGGPVKNLIFSGTLAKHTGLFDCIDLFHSLSNYKLTIIGYSPDSSLTNKIRSICSGNPDITLMGIEKLVPYETVRSYQLLSDCGFIYYHEDPRVAGKIPTKVYEYLSAKIDIIIHHNSPWKNFINRYYDIQPIQKNSVWLLAQPTKEYINKSVPEELLWADEEKKLINMMNVLFH